MKIFVLTMTGDDGDGTVDVFRTRQQAFDSALDASEMVWDGGPPPRDLDELNAMLDGQFVYTIHECHLADAEVAS
jgi:hypothetical protein